MNALVTHKYFKFHFKDHFITFKHSDWLNLSHYTACEKNWIMSSVTYLQKYQKASLETVGVETMNHSL